MHCPHCNKDIHFEEADSWVYKYEKPPDKNVTGYEITHGFCPACGFLIVLLREGMYHEEKSNYDHREWLTNHNSEDLLYPKGINRPVAEEVPERYAQDFREAASVLILSPKASAAISRRILQILLRDECQVKASSLANEIAEFLEKSGIPSYISKAVDAIRNVGNFAAHPLKDTNTGEIMEVENGEAEWLLDVLDAMFDYIFVQPKRLETRKQQLNEKLKAIGKPPMKSEE
jgi:hypothetical protein